MRLQLDTAKVTAIHADTAVQALFAGYGELEVVEPCQAPLATGIAHQGQAAEGDIAVEQLDLQSRAVLPGQRQSAFADAMTTPQPGAGAGKQHQQKDIEQVDHGGSGRPRRPSLTHTALPVLSCLA